MRVGDVFRDADVVGIDELRAAREAKVVRDVDIDEGEDLFSEASMAHIGLVLRWIGAVCAAVIVFVIVTAIGALIWRRSGTDPLSTVKWTTALAAAAAVLAGAMVVPRGQRKAAALALWMLVSAATLWFVLQDFVAGRFSLANFTTFCFALLGGFIVYYSILSGTFSGRRINRVAGRNE
jgi:hypothetical protein